VSHVVSLLIVALATALVGEGFILASRRTPFATRIPRDARGSPLTTPQPNRLAHGNLLVGVVVGLFFLWSGARSLLAHTWLVTGYALGAILGTSALVLAHSGHGDDNTGKGES